MTPVEILRAARGVIADGRRFATGALARDESGRACHAFDACASCFCVLGAVMVAGREGTFDERSAASSALQAWAEAFLKTQPGASRLAPVARVNDEFGHSVVMVMVDETIEALALASAEGETK